ncbi:MAG: trypsin-like peptidase domain-containing protein [Planctomycetaceae bacterium]|jgi:hypothetical protein|nr:trypsin-like peptidase domain-containing protein [Planctomycetaceae bacterium]
MLRLSIIVSVLFVCSLTYASDNPLINASVKLRVDAANAHSWGTGTIIDTRSGEALVLTCGHIFRDSQGQGNIEVHLFNGSSNVTVLGRCLYYDLEIDLALVAIRPPCPVTAAAIAPEHYVIRKDQPALSVGCDGGGQPTVRTHTVMSTDRVGTPQNNAVAFHYVQVSGAPVSGRSGGGLFSTEGYLIGVCNTADPVENDGQFVPPSVIRYVLDQRRLTDIYKKEIDTKLLPANDTLVRTVDAGMKQRRSPLKPLEALPAAAESQPKVADVFTANVPAETAKTTSQKTITPKEKATLDEVKRLKQDGNEIVLIVKSRRNPDVPIDVIYLNNTSDEFIDSLAKNTSSAQEYDPVIFSSHETKSKPAEPSVAGQRPVSLSVPH